MMDDEGSYADELNNVEASDLGPFAQGFVSISHMVFKAAPEIRLHVFENSTAEAAQFVRKGLPKQTAFDKMVQIANAYGITNSIGVERVESIVAEAFEAARRQPEHTRNGEDAATNTT